jgi:hypothetical protein
MQVNYIQFAYITRPTVHQPSGQASDPPIEGDHLIYYPVRNPRFSYTHISSYIPFSYRHSLLHIFVHSLPLPFSTLTQTPTLPSSTLSRPSPALPPGFALPLRRRNLILPSAFSRNPSRSPLPRNSFMPCSRTFRIRSSSALSPIPCAIVLLTVPRSASPAPWIPLIAERTPSRFPPGGTECWTTPGREKLGVWDRPGDAGEG